MRAVNSGTASYHLVGIGGIGMSAIARLLLARGARVSGSDVYRSELVEALEAEGATVAIGHRAENVGRPDLVIVSSAIAHDNPEFVAAIERGIDIKTRGAMLAELTGARKTIAIAGTHGKTTTTAMAVTILERAGVEPTYAIGGLRVDTGTNAGTGAGPWFVTESDESDGSFLHLRPTIAVVTNVENDHLASDDELPRLLEQFATFVQRVPPDGCAIIGIDNRGSAFIAKSATVPKTTFATRTGADLVAHGIAYHGLGSRFALIERGHVLGEIGLNVPGEINVQNALAAIAVARTLKIDFPTIAAALEAFRGVRRRFEIVGEHGGVTVVDDYAHHPTAIAKTIAAARGYTGKPIVVAFQPHRYSRTRYLAADFAAALSTADAVLLAPIYAASEAPIEGVSERSIGEPLAALGTPVTYVANVNDLLEAIPRAIGDEALVLMLGAGSISGVAHRLGASLDALGAVVR
jgi:UDP-N-acetylmuramate--alanine ligase